jgi:hypothetical protein
MSNIISKVAAIEQVASQIHTGSQTVSAKGNLIKQFIAGSASTVNAPAVTYAFIQTDQDEYLKLTGLTGATTINLTADADIQVGATLTIDVVQGATGYNLVLGTGIVGADLTGVANDRDVLVLKYTGTEWVLLSNTKVIDAA